MNLLFFAFGLVFLIVGAEFLVRGSSRLAAAMHISPLVIGLTVVAFGTSSPEMAVSVKSAFQNQADIAVGNVVGSNIFNVLFILGLSAIITPLIVSAQLIRIDVPLMILVSIACLLLSLDLKFSRIDGMIMFCGLIFYILFLLRQSRKESAEIKQEFAAEFGDVKDSKLDLIKNIFYILVGLGLLVVGAKWLVDSSVAFAKLLGVSELIIGLTIIAAGTSLPEVFTSVIASIKGERDIAVGNVIGSNIFNIMGVLGLAAIVTPDGINVSKTAIEFDIPVMVAVAVICFPIFFSGFIISRWNGVLFFGGYLAYTAYLILAALKHSSLPLYSQVLLYGAMPITVLILLVMLIQGIRRYKTKKFD